MSILLLPHLKLTNESCETSGTTDISITINLQNKSSFNYLPSHQERNKFILDQCNNIKQLSPQFLQPFFRRNGLINYLGFILRSHSLFYCSVPKVATRTLLKFITYLHLRDEVLPMLKRYSSMNLSRLNSNFGHHLLSKIVNIDSSNEIFARIMKNYTNISSTENTWHLLSYLSDFMDFVYRNSSNIDLWSIYQNKMFPFIRLNTLTDPSIVFSADFVRAIIVRHPFERLASAYLDKIASLKSVKFSEYDRFRRDICKKYSSFYLVKEQMERNVSNSTLLQQKQEPCERAIPTFQHFVEYLKSGSGQADVHWVPYSKLCNVCFMRYNFIGKYENIDQDLNTLLSYFGFQSNSSNIKNEYKSPNSRPDYQSLYTNLSDSSICWLKCFYRDDLKFFGYKPEDYLLNQRSLKCSPLACEKKHGGRRF